jgi:glycosyltransferase involved in cell wall biosynthesis
MNHRRVVLAHDWLTGMRGGEKVLAVLADLFPDAPIYSLVRKVDSLSPELERRRIVTSYLNRLPGAADRYRYFLPLMPDAIQRLKVEPCDLVVSVSSCVAKGIIPPTGAKHLCYMLSPMRYLYDRYDDYFAPGRAGLAARTAMRLLRRRMQAWDRRSTDRIDSLVGISSFIGERIRSAYDRSAEIIHPPVDLSRFTPTPSPGRDGYYLIVSALVPYKNVDVAIEAFRRLDRKLVVVGSGPMEAELRRSARPNVEFRGWVDDRRLPEIIAGCRAFLFPNVEDFGIAPIEATSSGRPVIALGEGGSLDTVVDVDRFDAGRSFAYPRPTGPTGLFYSRPDAEGLVDAIRRFESIEARFNHEACRSWAEHFAEANFRRAIVEWIERASPGFEPIHRSSPDSRPDDREFDHDYDRNRRDAA